MNVNILQRWRHVIVSSKSHQIRNRKKVGVDGMEETFIGNYHRAKIEKLNVFEEQRS